MSWKDQKGQTLLATAAAMVVLMGFLGLGIDMGVLRYEKRLQQSAADAAAIAGASDLAPYSGVTTAAQAALATNGFPGASTLLTNQACPTSVTGLTVTVNNPPQSGPHSGVTGYVEVCVAQLQPTFFMKVLGFNNSTVSARAVAGKGLNGSACLYTLDPNTVGIEGININGSATLNAPNCGIVDNGNFDTKGGAYTVTAATVSVAGVETGKDNVTCTSEPTNCPVTGAPAASDPLSYLSPPPVGAPVNFNSGNIIPGTYNGISLSGNGTYTFPSGIYVLDGGSFTCNGTPTIQGTGVMFYFTNGATWNCSGNDTVNLSAPTSGPYEGILLYQNPACNTSSCDPTIGGNVGSSFQGALYFPKSQVVFFGNAGTSFGVALVVAGSVALSGNPLVNLTGTAGLPPGVNLPIYNSTLVE